jgi:prophage regulatory protein
MKILKLKEVIQKTSLARASIYRLIAEGKFPKQIKLSERSAGWLESEINDWLTNRIAERDRA